MAVFYSLNEVILIQREKHPRKHISSAITPPRGSEVKRKKSVARACKSTVVKYALKFLLSIYNPLLTSSTPLHFISKSYRHCFHLITRHCLFFPQVNKISGPEIQSREHFSIPYRYSQARPGTFKSNYDSYNPSLPFVY